MNKQTIVAVCGVVGLMASAARAGGSSVIINEVLTKPSTGNQEWVELFNTTDADIDLASWKLTELTNPQSQTPVEKTMLTLSGIIPAGGILAFDVGTSKLNNDGDSIGLYEGTTQTHRLTYGTVTGYAMDIGVPVPTYTISWKNGLWGFSTTTKGLPNNGRFAPWIQ